MPYNFLCRRKRHLKNLEKVDTAYCNRYFFELHKLMGTCVIEMSVTIMVMIIMRMTVTITTTHKVTSPVNPHHLCLHVHYCHNCSHHPRTHICIGILCHLPRTNEQSFRTILLLPATGLNFKSQLLHFFNLACLSKSCNAAAASFLLDTSLCKRVVQPLPL